MKIAVGHFYQESTTFNPIEMGQESFAFVEGEEVIDRLAASKVFRENDVEIVPTIFASATSGGCVTEEAYHYFADKIINVIKTEKDLDGIWLHLHGSMEVVNIGSGEAELLREIREIVGNELPISLTLDLHANIDDDVPKLANIIRGYRTVPHVDQAETEEITAQLLIDCIKNEEKITSSFVRIPMVAPGEKGTSDTEPMKSILKKTYEYEKIKGISIANFFNGHVWTDRPNTTASAIVVPESEEYTELANKVCQEFADFAFSLRHDFQLRQLTLDPDEAIQRALTEDEKPIFITDSGDNTTGGAPGINTLLLQKIMEKDTKGKKIVVAAILDEETCDELSNYNVGDEVTVDIGVGYDSDSAPVEFKGVLKAKGDLLAYYSASGDITGKVNTISNGNIDVVVADHGDSFTTVDHFTKAGLDIDDYDVLVLKQGYLFDDLNKISKLHIMAMTPGATNLIIEDLEFNQLQRPIYPLDDI